jgi:hypothetical protein
VPCRGARTVPGALTDGLGASRIGGMRNRPDDVQQLSGGVLGLETRHGHEIYLGSPTDLPRAEDVALAIAKRGWRPSRPIV